MLAFLERNKKWLLCLAACIEAGILCVTRIVPADSWETVTVVALGVYGGMNGLEKVAEKVAAGRRGRSGNGQ